MPSDRVRWSELPKTPFEKALFKLYETPTPSRIFKVVSQERGRGGVVSRVEIDLSLFRTAHHQEQDPRAIFTQAYEKITETVLGKVLEHRFDHRVWLATLDDAFASYYFDASAAYDQARWKDVPKLWKLVFDAIGVGEPALTFPPKAAMLERLLLPLLVHSIHDLPLAVAELAVEEAKFLKAVVEGKEPDEAIQQAQILGFACAEVAKLREAGTDIRAFQQYIGDYSRINNMLFEENYKVIDEVQQTTISYSPFLLDLFDALAGQYDEILTYRTLQFIRGKAWFEATRLVEANSIEEGEAIRRSIEEDTEVLIKIFYDPSSRFRTSLLHCARAVSGLFQAWPEDPSLSPNFNPPNS